VDDIGTYDFAGVQGSAWEMHFTFEASDGSGGYVPVNLTGSALSMHLRPQYRDDDNATNPAGVAAITVVDAAAGEFTATLTDTEDLNGVYVYDLDLVDAGGVRRTLCRGRFEFLPEVTR
jgi:hypothetical protein